MVGQISLFYECFTEVNVKGKKIAITGRIDMQRKEAIKMIEEQGGEYTSYVSRDTDLLIRGYIADSRKFRDAKRKNIKVLDVRECENQLLRGK